MNMQRARHQLRVFVSVNMCVCVCVCALHVSEEKYAVMVRWYVRV